MSTNNVTSVPKTETLLELLAEPTADSHLAVMAFVTTKSNVMMETTPTVMDALPLATSNAVTEEETETKSATTEHTTEDSPTHAAHKASLLDPETSAAHSPSAVMALLTKENNVMRDSTTETEPTVAELDAASQLAVMVSSMSFTEKFVMLASPTLTPLSLDAQLLAETTDAEAVLQVPEPSTQPLSSLSSPTHQLLPTLVL